ncbi:MAG: threonine synthase [Anaerolineales bacterium]|nr:threonine synthase [Anaerolineales bacterium]
MPEAKDLIRNIWVECLDCGHQAVYSATLTACPACQGQWLQARYTFQPALTGDIFRQRVTARPMNLWRYGELLPVYDNNPSLYMGEGATPLIRATNLGMMLGCPNLYIKDERQGPTCSFKDRQAAVNIAALKEAGVTEIVLASTGNVAIAYAAYAARAGIKLWAFLTSLVPAEKMREVAIYGTQVVKVTATYDQTKKLAAEYARQRNLYLERGARSIPSVEAMKTIAFEICEQLNWVSPDWYIQSVSGGMGPLGVQKGFYELQQLGLIGKQTPAMAIIQVEGCSPMVRAWRENKAVAEPVTSPNTHIATLATGDPGRTYTLLRQRILNGGVVSAPQTADNESQLEELIPWEEREGARRGVFESVTDEEAFRAMHLVAKLEGISIEPAAAVAFAGLIKLIRAGVIKPSEVIAVNCTGHTMPIETSILGEGWARNVVLPSELEERRKAPPVPAAGRPTETLPEERPAVSAGPDQEGLLAALSRVTPGLPGQEHTPRVLIVDDTEHARRLIRRILQSQGNYTILEAASGSEALEMVSEHRPGVQMTREQYLDQLPDVILLDLMMPEMDGFTVLDALKANPHTASIPVIVVTAKELTSREKERLSGQIDTLMQKGQFLSDDLLEEVRQLTGGAGEQEANPSMQD